MKRLTVLFDPTCGVCTVARRWLERQEQLVPLEFLGAGTKEALARFPTLTADETRGELTVVGEDRYVYRGDRAYVMCLWALARHRARAVELGRSPAQRALARGFIRTLSKHRHTLSGVIGAEPELSGPPAASSEATCA